MTGPVPGRPRPPRMSPREAEIARLNRELDGFVSDLNHLLMYLDMAETGFTATTTAGPSATLEVNSDPNVSTPDNLAALRQEIRERRARLEAARAAFDAPPQLEPQPNTQRGRLGRWWQGVKDDYTRPTGTGGTP